MNTLVSEPGSTIASLGERGLIALIRARFPSSAPLSVGIGDDAAVAVPERGALEVLTTDALVEGVHFDLALSSFFDVGYKALAVNVSDVASMGGTSRLALLSLILPPALLVADAVALLDGFAAMAADAGVVLAGGNITRSPGPLIVDVSLVGAVRPRKVLTRGGGRPGDAIYVSGQVGSGLAGLEWLQRGETAAGVPADLEDCVRRYRRPEPRHRLGRLLGGSRAASACMDTSDGLADAVRQIAAASGTGAKIDAALLPIAEGAGRWFSVDGGDPASRAAAGGDDYELVFTVPPRRRGRLRTALQHARGVPVTRIGELTSDPAVVLWRDGATVPLGEGFTHF